jgi:6-phosphofructokinase 2
MRSGEQSDIPPDRVVTLTMNPALDVATSVAEMTPAIKLRCDTERSDPGGGGLNAARLIARLCGDVLAVHTNGGPTGQRLVRLLEEDGVPQRIVPIEDETRRSLAVTERSTGDQYRFVLPGPRLSAEEGHAALDAVLDEVAPGTLVLASGSLPRGVPLDFYGRLASEVADAGGRLAVDTHGEPLRLALEAGVHLIKPNWRELDALAGVRRGRGDLGRLRQAEALIGDGSAEIVIVTLGDQGALVATADGHLEIEPPAVEPVSTVGGGDAFAGGLLFALARGASLEAACRLAVACAAATVCTAGTAMPLRRDVETIHRRIARDWIGDDAEDAGDAELTG